ncbi:Pre-mRNA-splicing factor ATP-dependent RNA helicase [Nymphaea thermarum]|nr:Pre-mRNA-splicing factor ATP-dependent RNA helicase [Nymphaea thermarum]
MAIISKKHCALIWAVQEKHVNNFRNGSKQGDIPGVEKTAEQIDAGTPVMGEEGEVDFKKGAKFAAYFKDQGEAYLPMYSMRHELLHVIPENQVMVVVGETGPWKQPSCHSIFMETNPQRMKFPLPYSLTNADAVKSNDCHNAVTAIGVFQKGQG